MRTETIEQKAIELIEKFEALATDTAPDAMELGLMAARVSAGQSILSLVISIMGVVVLWKVSVFLWRKFVAMDGFASDTELCVPLAVGGIFTSAGTIILTFGVFMSASIWPFVGIFYPELWIAKQVLGW